MEAPAAIGEWRPDQLDAPSVEADIDMRALRYECVKVVPGERATHVFLRKNA